MKVTAQYVIHNTKYVRVIAPGKRIELFKIYISIYFYIFLNTYIFHIFVLNKLNTIRTKEDKSGTLITEIQSLEPRKINQEP